jgi:Ser/Thr protein kinase RdoA (MazF antagonist)
VNPAISAAVEVARQFGINGDKPQLIQETNHTVVWLRPCAVIAKVGTRRDAEESLMREFEVATDLASRSAPVARPFTGSIPTRHDQTEYFVTVWQRLERDMGAEVLELEIGDSLKRVHTDLEQCSVSLPSFTVSIFKARDALFDDARMSAMPRVDRDFLRRSFNRVLEHLDDYEVRQQPLHGEPHAGNYITTRDGIRWLDFENACLGPLEWGLAFLSDEAREAFSDFDDDLVRVLRSLISVCVATWCGSRRAFPRCAPTAGNISTGSERPWMTANRNVPITLIC